MQAVRAGTSNAVRRHLEARARTMPQICGVAGLPKGYFLRVVSEPGTIIRRGWVAPPRSRWGDPVTRRRDQWSRTGGPRPVSREIGPCFCAGGSASRAVPLPYQCQDICFPPKCMGDAVHISRWPQPACSPVDSASSRFHGTVPGPADRWGVGPRDLGRGSAKTISAGRGRPSWPDLSIPFS